MIKKIFRKIVDRLFLRKIDDIKVQKGMLFEKYLQTNLKNIKSLDEVYFKVFSQDTEDGIIQYCLKTLNIDNLRFVEIGTQDYSESNTRYLFDTMRCEGLIVDPYPNLKKKINSFLRLWKNTLHIHNDFADEENINSILKKYSMEKKIDLFSIDIDGNDYWILKALPDDISKIFVIEYNPFFGHSKEISTPNIKKFERFNYHPSGFCWGASLKAIINLMKSKGYTFIGTNRLNVNAFFIQNKLINNFQLDIPDSNEIQKFTEAKFKYSKDETKYNIEDIKVYDLKRKLICNFSDLE